ncbi:hypothetical protein Pla123a_14760 [Posidoniimonas polymericola]|uniref:Chorismate pyruvate-lyase n=1 Tax=Posidoniimonas polymericola TaxID=2528002 RepID=A0A5C5YSE7_9BACT|nr:hypothetical protein [Posidoniimonas polymericola]TWT77680.1 hypothetical protein Pla123a_14760 [Posidoniimonas polymericola]
MPGRSQLSAEVGESHRPEMLKLAGVFYSDPAPLGELTAVSAADMPPHYQALLAHDDHMTVTLEAFHESLVKVVVVQEQSAPDSYVRKSLLTRHSDGTPVQLGIMRIDLTGLPDLVRQQIETHAAPLGRILIRNNLLREVELLALWRIEPGDDLREQLRLQTNQPIYGRSARILVDGRPAVELLEIVQA